MWFVYAFLSALFAALTSVLAKVGVDGVNSNLATAIRTTVILVLAWGIVWMTGTNKQLTLVSPKSWTFLILSGLTTGGSWLFFYKALQMGTVSRVVSVDKFSVVLAILLSVLFLHEVVSLKVLIGSGLITAGVLCMVL
ncbi:EamA family transporter [Candidatus Avelusimicrobium fimicolum]|uniref:EamA family transporter n=1 Tax=Candidatus Avelusimicrobium fimicolum TaxID=3416216 RepID=UPI0015AF56E9|nr:EamA family transporter [Elusimicrobiaceae bacterium]